MDSSAQCLLEFHPWLSDRVMGLNHQLAALSCAIAEAVALNRTLVFPEALCISVKHELRWHAKGRQPSPGCVGEKGVTGFSVPTSTLLDLDGIRQLVPIELRRLDVHPPPPASHDATNVDRTWTTDRIARDLPCSRAPFVRRRVSGYWFRPCSYNLVQCDALSAVLDAAVGARGELYRRRSSCGLAVHMLRSGLFYAAPIRAAAAAVRHALGGWYAAVHVRRSDRLRVGYGCGDAATCAEAAALTGADALLARLGLWYPPGTPLYVGSTEPPSYFEQLRRRYNLTFAEDLSALRGTPVAS